MWCGSCSSCVALEGASVASCGCPAGDGVDAVSVTVSPLSRPGGTAFHAPARRCLHQLGAVLAHAVYYGAQLADLPLLTHPQLLRQVADMVEHTSAGSLDPTPTIPQAFAVVTSHLQHLVESLDLSPQSVGKLTQHMAGLVLYTNDGLGLASVDAIEHRHVLAWVNSPLNGRRHKGKRPTVATRHLRRSAARLFFRILRSLSLCTGDPTLDISLPARTSRKTRHLSDSEIVMVQVACGAQGSHRATVVALAEATATSGELNGILIQHFDRAGARVWLVGTRRRSARWGYLSGWGVRQVQARVDALIAAGATETTPITYEGQGSAESKQASACAALRKALDEAGLSADPSVQPGSIAAAYGRRLFKVTNRDLLGVRDALGVRSLDQAAEIIGLVRRDATDDTDRRAAVLSPPALHSQRPAKIHDRRAAARAAAKAARAASKPKGGAKASKTQNTAQTGDTAR